MNVFFMLNYKVIKISTEQYPIEKLTISSPSRRHVNEVVLKFNTSNNMTSAEIIAKIEEVINRNPLVNTQIKSFSYTDKQFNLEFNEATDANKLIYKAVKILTLCGYLQVGDQIALKGAIRSNENDKDKEYFTSFRPILRIERDSVSKIKEGNDVFFSEKNSEELFSSLALSYDELNKIFAAKAAALSDFFSHPKSVNVSSDNEEFLAASFNTSSP